MKSKFKNIDLVLPSEMTTHVLKEDRGVVDLPSFHNLFTLHRIENFRNLHKLVVPPHRKPVYDFVFLTKGNTVRYRNFNNYKVYKNQFCFLPAYEILSGEKMSEDIQGFYCHFDLRIFEGSKIDRSFVNHFSFLQANQNNLIKIDEPKVESILFLLNRLECQYWDEKEPNFNLISSYLYVLFLEIQKFVKKVNVNQHNSAAHVTKNYQEILRTEIYNYSKVSDFAELLSITPNYLNRCVTSTLGKSAKDLFHQMLILESKVLLKQSSLSIAEIAYKLTKKEPSDFIRFFKSKTGYTPKVYRDTTEKELAKMFSIKM